MQSFIQIHICTLMPFNAAYFFYQYPALPVKRATKSWRHPLRKPTARAVSTAVKQQAVSDDGKRKHRAHRVCWKALRSLSLRKTRSLGDTSTSCKQRIILIFKRRQAHFLFQLCMGYQDRNPDSVASFTCSVDYKNSFWWYFCFSKTKPNLKHT